MSVAPSASDIQSPLSASLDHPAVYQSLINAMPAAVYVCDAEGRLVMYNDAAAELWGRRPELRSTWWCGSWKIFTPEGAPLDIETSPIAVALREGRSVRGAEIIIERPDGTRRHIRPNPEPLRDATGRIVGAINILFDLTEVRERERDRALLAAIVDSSNDAIISKTLDGTITSWNAGAERIFGYTAEEAVGRHVTMLIPPERIAEEKLILGRLRAGDRIEHCETVRMAKSGERLNISLTVSPVRDTEGRLIGASKIARNVTAHKRAEEALRRSEAELRTLISVLPVGVCACDVEGRFSFFNARAVEMIGRAPDLERDRFSFSAARFDTEGHLISPDRSPMALAVREGRSFRDLEIVIERPSGRRFTATVNIDPLRDERGAVRGAICVFQDTSVQAEARELLKNQRRMLEEAVAKRTVELEESHQRLRLAERMASLGTLSAGLGHDMGNLLFPVRMILDSFAAAPLPESMRADLDKIQTAIQYLQQLANGLRMMSLDPDSAPGADEPIQLRPWWTDIMPIVRNVLPKGTRLEADIGDDAWVCMTRPALSQVVFNLVQNAGEVLKGRPNSWVRVTARTASDGVLLTVEDNGPGMSAETLNRCMEPFFTTKPRAISTGLGLVLVGGIVRQAGGKVEISSEEGRGTTFRLWLPRAAPHDASRHSNGHARGMAIVELRDARLRSLIASELRQLGYTVGTNGSETPVDLAVCDAPAAGVDARKVVLVSDDKDREGAASLGARPSLSRIRLVLREAVRDLHSTGGPQ